MQQFYILNQIKKNIIKEIQAWEEKRITEQIDKRRDELLKHYKGEEGRKNELSNALSKSLNRLADRIDRGMDIDVTTSATVTENGEGKSPTELEQIEAKRRSIESIQKDMNTICQIERNQEPVLRLSVIEDD